MKNINWAVLGTGVIANEMAVALKKNGGFRLRRTKWLRFLQ